MRSMRGPPSFMMELYIETLTGTAFELRVSPFETIQSVKMKIQRLEGIPISQQHLIWNAMELDDEFCLHDYNIHDGATLKLVLAMRGGPINTRRIPMEDPTLREMAELMEASRDEIEKIPGKQVTLLVFRDGDHFNLFRVVDRGDGTLTPLSETFSNGSVYNFEEEEHEVESPVAVVKETTVEENEQMKEKMKELRSKMETMTVGRKPKKKVLVPRPPSSGRPGSKSRIRRLTSAGKRSSQPSNLNSSLNKNIALPPVGQSGTLNDTVLSHEVLSLIAQSTAGARQLAGGSSLETKPVSAKRRDRVDNSAKLRHSLNLSSVKEDSTEIRPLTSSRLRGSEVVSSLDALTPIETPQPSSPRKEIVYEHYKDTPSLVRPITSSRKKELTLESIKESLRPSTSSSKQKGSRVKDGVCVESSGGGGGGSWRPSTTSKYAGGATAAKKEYTIESLGEAHGVSGLLRQTSIERIGASRIGFIPSPTRSRMSNIHELQGRVRTPEGRLVSARIQKLSSANLDGRLMSPSSRLPPVKAKKKSKRCFLCSKKTGLATSYNCRCGENFCATHRYAESHDCTFDYKTEGRKLLEQSNPVVSAPKLPKI